MKTDFHAIKPAERYAIPILQAPEDSIHYISQTKHMQWASRGQV